MGDRVFPPNESLDAQALFSQTIRDQGLIARRGENRLVFRTPLLPLAFNFTTE